MRVPGRRPKFALPSAAVLAATVDDGSGGRNVAGRRVRPAVLKLHVLRHERHHTRIDGSVRSLTIGTPDWNDGVVPMAAEAQVAEEVRLPSAT